MMLYTKYESIGLVVTDKKIFEITVKTLIFDPVTYLHNQSEQFEQCW